ncbi:MAG: glycosyl hydrolase-related protein, partial [Planctomycetota bacterium]
TAAEQLVQSERLWAMLNPTGYPVEEFEKAWRNVLLYDEHTWGAHCSIREPDSDFTKGQWKIKQAFALKADTQSRKLLNDSLTDYQSSEKNISAVDVFNTQSWMRTDIVILPKDMTVAGDVVKGINGKVVSSQRLSTGELAFMAEDILPFAAKRFTFQASQSDVYGNAKANGNSLRNSLIELLVDQKTGAITSLICKSLNTDIVDRKSGLGLNDYFYVPGNNPDDAKRNGPVKISVKEQGPLIASLLIESEAPGCHNLTRELRVIDSFDRVDLINIIDKQNIYDPEGVHLAFPFNVPDGVMRMDIPWAVARPEVDQLTGANRNFFTVQRWVDVSNQDYGVTWATVDAPLVEVGSITAPTRGVSPDWMRFIKPSQTLYSYVMNNYWYTNYKAGQEGPTVFRYSIKPHKQFDSAEASRFGIERSQPLVVVPVDKKTPVLDSVLTVKPAGIIATAFKPSNDGKARILRLFNAGGQPEKASLLWTKRVPETIWLSNLAEEQVSKITGPIDMATYEIVTLRIPLSVPPERAVLLYKGK